MATVPGGPPRPDCVVQPAGRPATVGLAVALPSFASAALAGRLAVARRSCSHRIDGARSEVDLPVVADGKVDRPPRPRRPVTHVAPMIADEAEGSGVGIAVPPAVVGAFPRAA